MVVSDEVSRHDTGAEAIGLWEVLDIADQFIYLISLKFKAQQDVSCRTYARENNSIT